MAKPFTTWTVLPHDPIEKLSDNLWRVTGRMPDGSTQRQMILARRKDGRIVVHNGIALDDAEMKEIDAWGEVSTIFVPNGFHRQDAAIWKQRYPKATVVAPRGSAKRVSKVVAVERTVEDTEKDDDTVQLVPLDGVPIESLLEVHSKDGVTLVFNDAVMNVPKLGGMMGLMLAPTGRVALPRLIRLFGVKDKRAFAAQLDRLAALPDLRRVLVGHGAPIQDDPRGALRAVATQLGGPK